MKIFYFLLLSCMLCFANTQMLSNKDFSIDLNGMSDGFKIKTNDTFYNMKYGWLTETNVPNNKVKLNFPELKTGSVDSYSYVNTYFNDKNLNVEIKNMMFQNSTFYTNDKNQSVYVPKNSLKITIKITGWTFNNPNNKLVLDFTLTNSKGKDLSDINKNVINAKQLNFVFEPTCFIDNELTHNVTISSKNNKYYIEFPSFKNELYYDPSLTSGTSGVSIFKINVILLIIMSCIAIIN